MSYNNNARNAATGERPAGRRPPRTESSHTTPQHKEHQTHMAPADFRNLSEDKKREQRNQERGHKKDMKRSMNYFRHVGEALKEVSSGGAGGAAASEEHGGGGSAAPALSPHEQQQARAGIVDGFSTELIKKLRQDFTLLYRSSAVCRTIEQALAAGATRAHVDALLYVFLGHMREMLSTPKTSYLVETLFAALYHTVGMECAQRGGPEHIDDIVETPSAASTPSLRQLLDGFAEEVCADLDGTGRGGAAAADWIYQRSAARGLASILRSLSGKPGRGAPAHDGVALHFAVQPIARTIRRKFITARADAAAAFVECALDNSMTHVVQALIASPLPAVSEMFVRDIAASPEVVVPALLAPVAPAAAAAAIDGEDGAAAAAAAQASNNGARVLEAAIEASPRLVCPAVVGFLQKSKRAASEASLFVIASLIRATESHTEVLEMFRRLVQPRLPAVLLMTDGGSELSALARIVRRIHAVQGAGLPKTVKEIRTDVVHAVVEACRQVNNNEKQQQADAAQAKKQHPLLIICGQPTSAPPAAASDGAAMAAQRQQHQMRQRAGLELLDAVLELGLGPASMLVHSWEKVPADLLRDFACTNTGSRALQALVPHIAATRVNSNDVSQSLDVLEQQEQKQQQQQQQQGGLGNNRFGGASGAASAAGGNNRPTASHVTLQPNLQKLLRRLTNGEVGDASCRATRDFPALRRLICNNFSAFLMQKIYDEAVLWLKAAIVRRVSKLFGDDVAKQRQAEEQQGHDGSAAAPLFDPQACGSNLAAKKLALHIRMETFEYRPDEWKADAEKAANAKKLMSVILAAAE